MSSSLRPEPVEVAVSRGRARIERRVDRGDALGAIGRTVEIRHAHAAEADRADLRSVRAQFSPLHRRLLRGLAGKASDRRDAFAFQGN